MFLKVCAVWEKTRQYATAPVLYQYAHECVCVCWERGKQGVGEGFVGKCWRGAYILVMLIEFYKLWLTPLPTADWILNKHSQVDESRAASVRSSSSSAFTRAPPPRTRPRSQRSVFAFSSCTVQGQNRSVRVYLEKPVILQLCCPSRSWEVWQCVSLTARKPTGLKISPNLPLILNVPLRESSSLD